MPGCRARRPPAFPTAGSLTGSYFFQLLTEFVQDRLGVRHLDARLLDPVLDDRAGALLRLGPHRRRRRHDVRAGCLERAETDLVGTVPGLALAPGVVLPREPVARHL